MINPPTNHHFVPKCYLNSFTDTQKRFWKKRNDNSRISQVYPTQVCYEPNANKFLTNQILKFYNLDDEYYVEKNAFKFQENNYSRTLIQILKFQKEPKVIDKIKYRLFLETLLTIKRRNPVSRNEILESFKKSYKTEEGIKDFLNFLSEETGISDFPVETENFIRYYLAVESQNPNRLHDMYLSAFINKKDYTTISNLTNDLFNLKQYLLFAPISQQFITSDNPGFLISGGTLSTRSGFGGNFEFYFPLSPLTCLYLNSKKIESPNILQKTVYNIILDAPSVKVINENTKKTSRNYILSFSKKTLENV